MKTQSLGLFIFVLVGASTAFGKLNCVKFSTKGYSERVKSLTFISKERWSSKSQTAYLKGTIENSPPVFVPFKCTAKGKKAICIQDKGGGDFTLSGPKQLSMSLTYINLKIGAVSGTTPAAPDEELDEELAVFLPPDKDQEEDHLGILYLKANSFECDETDSIDDLEKSLAKDTKKTSAIK